MPQAFKGTLSAHAAAGAMGRGCRAAFPNAEIIELPMADGGDDTLDVLVANTGGRLSEASVRGPLGEDVRAEWGVLGDGRTAVIEMARASGLRLLDPERLDPLATTTYGTGQLIREALDSGYRDILVGVGGSATIDGGAGAVSALGVRFLDADGGPFPPCGGALRRLATIDVSGLDARVADARIRVACDVDIPFVGPTGPRNFMAQKGCDDTAIDLLTAGLEHYCRAVAGATGVDLRAMPMSGPAGGLAGGLHAFLDAELAAGAKLVLDTMGLDQRLAGADLVLVGEGCLDGGTLSGKGTLGVAHAARDAGVPALAICGEIEPALPDLRPHGIVASLALAGPQHSANEARARAAELVEETTNYAVLAQLSHPGVGSAGL